MKYSTAVSVVVSVVAVASAASLPTASTKHIRARQDMKSAIDKLVAESKDADGFSDKSLNDLLDHAFELAGQPRDSSTGSSSSVVCTDGKCVTTICDANGKCTKSTRKLGKRSSTKNAKRQDFGGEGFDPFSFIPPGIPGITAPLPPNNAPQGGSTSTSCSNGFCVTTVCDANGKCKTTKSNQGNKRSKQKRQNGFDPNDFIPEGIPGVNSPFPPGIPGLTAPIPPNQAPNPPDGGSTSSSCSNGFCVTTVCDANGKCKTTNSNQGNNGFKQKRQNGIDPNDFIPEGIPGVNSPFPPGIPGLTEPIPPNQAPNPPQGGSTTMNCNNGTCITKVCDANGICKTTTKKQNRKRHNIKRQTTISNSPDGSSEVKSCDPSGDCTTVKSSADGSSSTESCHKGECSFVKSAADGSSSTHSCQAGDCTDINCDKDGKCKTVIKTKDGKVTTKTCEKEKCTTEKCDASGKCQTKTTSNTATCKDGKCKLTLCTDGKCEKKEVTQDELNKMLNDRTVEDVTINSQ